MANGQPISNIPRRPRAHNFYTLDPEQFDNTESPMNDEEYDKPDTTQYIENFIEQERIIHNITTHDTNAEIFTRICENKKLSTNTEFKIMGHNINGIRSNEMKLHSLLDYCKVKRTDIIGISETNIDRNMGAHLDINIQKEHDYVSFWTKDDKIKGSGVGLCIKKQWSKYIGKIYHKVHTT